MDASATSSQGASALLPKYDIPESAWRKSQRSINNGACVEVARPVAGVIAVRDSKDPRGPVLTYTSDEWNAFLGSAKNGDFDLR